MRALVLQHIACEPPGVYEDVLRERVATIHRVELDEGEPLPAWREFDVIIAMGGPMSANEEAENPWLVDEKRLIAESVRAGVPFFGACLGAQLLAASLGARVYAGPQPEVGLLPVFLTDAAIADRLKIASSLATSTPISATAALARRLSGAPSPRSFTTASDYRGSRATWRSRVTSRTTASRPSATPS